jgi:hypothetical protein
VRSHLLIARLVPGDNVNPRSVACDNILRRGGNTAR